MVKKIIIAFIFLSFPLSALSFDKEVFYDSFLGIKFKKLNSKTYIGVYEITQDQWFKVMGTKPYTYVKGGNYPAETVSVSDIQKFITILNQNTKSKYRLPTVNEWLEAAGQVKHSKDVMCQKGNVYDLSGNNKYANGNMYFDCDDTYADIAPVGSFPPNENGYYDMVGNVKEWMCNSINDKTDSCAHLLGAARLAVAGSSHLDGPKDTKKVVKDDRTSLKASDLGFRLAIDLKHLNPEFTSQDGSIKVIVPEKNDEEEKEESQVQKPIAPEEEVVDDYVGYDDSDEFFNELEASIKDEKPVNKNGAINDDMLPSYYNDRPKHLPKPKEEVYEKKKLPEQYTDENQNQFRFLPFLRDAENSEE